MSVQQQLTCRVTEDLPGALKTFDGGKWGNESPGMSFPGVLLTDASRLCAAMGFHIDAGAVVSVAEPLFCSPESPAVQSEWTMRLFEEVVAETTRRNCGSIRAIEPIGSHDDLPMLPLIEAGFSVQATIRQWTRSLADCRTLVSCRNPDRTGLLNPAFQHVHGDALVNDLELRRKVRHLLTEILADATDLVALPSPDPEELLNDWIRQDAILVLAREADALIGLCCFVTEKFDAAEALIDEIQIQYIGVTSEFRNRRVASQLINALAASFPGHADSIELKFARVMTFCDVLNLPAIRLYVANGFKSQADFRVWCRRVEMADARQIQRAEQNES